MNLDALLTHCRLADGRLVDIGIAGGRIATIGENAAPSLSNRVPILDVGGDLVVPGLVDGYMHLDKTLMGLPVDAAYGGAEPDEPHRDGQKGSAAPAGLHGGTRRQADRGMRGARHCAPMSTSISKAAF
jgi:predicted amidohydrolase YtcJ